MALRFAVDDGCHECTITCLRRSAGVTRCVVTGQVVHEAPAETHAPRRPGPRPETASEKGHAFAGLLRSLLSQLLSGSQRRVLEHRRSERGRAQALKYARNELAAARGRICLSTVLFATWARVERAGGDVRDAVRASEATQKKAIKTATDYYCAKVLPFARQEHRPADKYLALALLYHTKISCPALASLQHLLPELRMLKHYNLQVKKFTNAQRYVKSAELWSNAQRGF